MNCVHCLLTRERRIQWINTCTLVEAATASTGRGRNGKDPISIFCCMSLPKCKRFMKRCWVFSVISSQPHWQIYYFLPSLICSAEQYGSSFCLIKLLQIPVCFFYLASASSQLFGRYLRFLKCVHCLLTRQRRIQWINTCTLVATATASTGGGGNGKDPISLFCCISLPKWKHYMRGCLVFSVHVHW